MLYGDADFVIYVNDIVELKSLMLQLNDVNSEPGIVSVVSSATSFELPHVLFDDAFL